MGGGGFAPPDPPLEATVAFTFDVNEAVNGSEAPVPRRHKTPWVDRQDPVCAPGGRTEAICDDRTKEKNVIRKSPSICTTLARREYWGAVDLLSTKTDQTIQQHCFLFCGVLFSKQVS